MHSYDAVVVGGGIIGLSCADRLAGHGLKVLLLERGQCGQEASWTSAGILSPCSWHRRDDLARIHMDALFGYHRFAAEVQEASGIDVQFRRCGKLQLILDDNRMKMARREVDVTQDRRTPEGDAVVRTLSVVEAQSLEPNLQGTLLGVQHCRMTAQVRNPRLMQALALCCRRRGARVQEGVSVVALLKDKQRVLGVETDRGKYHGAATVLCAGAWTSQLDPRLDETAPVHPVRGQIILLHMDPPPLRHILDVAEQHFYMVPRSDGHLLIGSTEEHDVGYSRRNTAEGLAKLSSTALRYVPVLRQAILIRTWAGLRPGTPDRRAFLGLVPGLDNLIVATGHFRTGLTVAPAVADIVADLIRKGTCDYDLKKCAPGREYPPQVRQQRNDREP